MISIEPGNREGPPESLTGSPRDIVVMELRGEASRPLEELSQPCRPTCSPRSSSCFTSALRMQAYFLPSFPEPAHFRPSTEEMAYVLNAGAFTWRLRTII